MKVIAIILGVLFVGTGAFLLFRRDFPLAQWDERGAAKKRAEKIIDAINGENSIKIKKMFSKSVQINNEQLEDDASALIEYIKCGKDLDEEIKLEYISASLSLRYTYDGNKRIYLQSWFDLSVGDEIYRVAFVECCRDRHNTKNEGVTWLYIETYQNGHLSMDFKFDDRWTEGIYFHESLTK